jgi:hypothetical protein
MSASKSQRSRRAVLGEDGEIQDLDSLLNDSAASNSEPQASPERDSAPSRATQGESIYCVRCGTANVYDASYCARCGKVLVEPGVQAAVNVPSNDQEAVRKSKRDWQSATEADPTAGAQFDLRMQHRMSSPTNSQFNVWAVASRAITLTFMAGMVISSLAFDAAWMGILALIAWLLVEIAQHQHVKTLTSMITEAITLVFVSGIVIASMAFGGWSMAIGAIALIAWLLVEIVRQ